MTRKMCLRGFYATSCQASGFSRTRTRSPSWISCRNPIGHSLVIPREPAETLFDLSPEGAAACIRTTQLVAAAVKRAFETPGLMITQVNGAAAGQTVPHVHFHIIPRRPGEQLLMHAAVRVDPEQLREHAERIRRWL